MIYELIISGLIAFAVAIITIPILEKKLLKRGIVGQDVHKVDKPKRAEMGGIGILLGFLSGTAAYNLLASEISAFALSAIIVLILIAMIGMFDDFSFMKQRYKPFLIGAATIPLIVTYSGEGQMMLPLIGLIGFGGLYQFIVIPLAITTSANFSNMFAGFNGLEAGVGALSLGTLGFLAILFARWEAAAIAIVLTVSLLAFLKFNWFPARIFPGDVGTLIMGAGIATVGIVGGLEFAAIAVSFPAAIDFTLKMIARHPFSQRGSFGDTVSGSDGVLVPPRYPALAHVFLRVAPLGERGLVGSLLSLQLVYCLLAIALTLLLT